MYHIKCTENDYGKDVSISWPSLVLLTNMDKPIKNNSSLRKFPSPSVDRSVVIACYDDTKTMLKLRQIIKSKSTCLCKPYLKLKKGKRKEDFISKNCNYFFTLDQVEIQSCDENVTGSANILISDIRDHRVSNKLISKNASGYWIRVNGSQSNFIMQLSLYKRVHEIHAKDKQRLKTSSKRETCCSEMDELMKIGELNISFKNLESNIKLKLRKGRNGKNPFLVKNTRGCHFLPTFCCKEKYIQITTSLHECSDNGQFDIFNEMLNKFSCSLSTDSVHDIELSLFLQCEKSQCLAMQGKFAEAKQLLLEVTEKVISKSNNRIFILNQAYLSLANIHLTEGNYGNAEECLNVLQKDKKNGIPFEQMVNFYYLYGVILMGFSEALSNMALPLLDQSHNFFSQAIKLFDSILPNCFYKYCRIYLYMAKYYLYYPRYNSVSVNKFQMLDNAKTQLNMIENHGMEKLSNRLQCFYYIVRGELQYQLGNQLLGEELVSKGLDIAKTFNFYLETKYCENSLQKMKSCNKISEETAKTNQFENCAMLDDGCGNMSDHFYWADDEIFDNKVL